MSGRILQKEELTELLLAVLKTLRVAEGKFRLAASVVRDVKIRRALLKRARCWARAARELSGFAALERAAAGMAQAGAWVASVCLPRDLPPLDECERCEEAVALGYRDALEHRLPHDVERVLTRQFAEILDQFGALHRLLAETGAEAKRLAVTGPLGPLASA